MKKQIHRGEFQLLATIVVLGISALLLLGVLVQTKKSYSKSDINTEYSNATEIITNTRSMLKIAGQYDFSSADAMTGALIQFGGAPGGMNIIGSPSSGTAKIKNNWGGAVTITPATVAGTDKAGFSLTYEKVPFQACEALATQLSQASGISTSSINGANNVGTVTANNASSQCTDNDNNILVFTTDN